MQIQIQGKRRVQVLSALLLYLLGLGVFIHILIRTPKNSNLALNGLFNYMLFGAILFVLFYFLVSTIIDGGKEWLEGPGELIIDDDRLINTLSYTSTSIIRMDEIATTEIRSYKEQQFLLIHLKDEEKLLDRRNIYVKFLLKQRKKRLGSVIAISNDSVETSLHQIQWQIDTRKGR